MKAAPSHPLIDRAEEVRLSAASIEAVGSELPRSQPEVEALLVEAIEGNFARAFTLLSLAALNEGIVVDAALMVHGVRLLPDPRYVAKLVGRVSGDVAEALVGEVEGRRLSWEREAASLFLAAWWAQERELTHHNVSIARRARILAREPLGIESQLLLVAAGEILSDANFDLLMSRMAAAQSPAAAAMVADALLEYAKQPITWNVDDEDESAHVSTRRRSVARVGRNDPCPCGSGKKYKRCCIDKDQERLRDSSDIVGVTQAELRRELEDFLTLERINGLRAHELVRLDPKRIDPKLHRAVLNRLNQFWEIEAVRHFFAAVLFITLNREDFSFVIHLDRQPRTSRRREAQTGSRARSGSRSERTLDAVEHSRTLMEWWPFLIFHRGGLRIKVINNTRLVSRGSSTYEISPDGKRFLLAVETGEDPSPTELHVKTNWFEELKRLTDSN